LFRSRKIRSIRTGAAVEIASNQVFEVLSKCDAPKALGQVAPGASGTSPLMSAQPRSSQDFRDSARPVYRCDRRPFVTERWQILVSGVRRILRLHDWRGEETGSATLWISSSTVHQSDLSSSRAAAMNILVVAWRAGVPITSHSCERPRFALLANERDVEKVGLIGLVYGLIGPLLQFEFKDDIFAMSYEELGELNGSDHSWPQALSVLSMPLMTPHLGLCVVD
jgi:hypothetical protein